MSDRKKLVVVVTNGIDNERSSVAWSIANGGVASDPDDFMQWWANPETEFVNNLLGEEIMKAIDSLPGVFKTCILLVSVEGFSYDEAAEVLKSRLHKLMDSF